MAAVAMMAPALPTAFCRSNAYFSGSISSKKPSRKGDLNTSIGRGPAFLGRKFVSPHRAETRTRPGAAEARATSRPSLPSHGYDYYELLGVDPSASYVEIKRAYRWLQKRCHPDVADDLGHDMAILLNEAYSTLADDDARAVYDKVRVLLFADRDYSGQPLYSTWHGPEEEDRAIFVDELQCVGCLKCALLAKNTFAIEAKHGRARAVKQWGDGENVVIDAISACPVNCIKLVQREQLPSLEYVMSKQARDSVGTKSFNNGGKRVVNIFEEASSFLRKLEKRRNAAKQREATAEQQESVAQQQAREMAAAAIQFRAGNWWYSWAASFGTADTDGRSQHDWTNARAARGALLHIRQDIASAIAEAAAASTQVRQSQGVGSGTGSEEGEEFQLLREAAFRRRAAEKEGSGNTQMGARSPWSMEEEYWRPEEQRRQNTEDSGGARESQEGEEEEEGGVEAASSPDVVDEDSPEQTVQMDWQKISTSSTLFQQDKSYDSWLGYIFGTPFLAAMMAPVYVGLTMDETANLAGAETDIVSPLPAELTSGLMGRVVMASFAWYLIAAVVAVVVAFVLASVQKYQRSRGVGGIKGGDS